MAASSTNLEERLAPNHLVPDTEAIKQEALDAKEAREKEEDGGPEKDPLDDPRAELSYTFPVDYTDARGKRWSGSFTTKILTIGDREMVGYIQARKKVNLSVDSYSLLTDEIHRMLAHLSVSLTEKPKWSENLESLYDVNIVRRIFAEVGSHESYFFGWDTDEGSSDSKRGERKGDAA